MGDIPASVRAVPEIRRIGQLPEPDSARFGAKAIWLDRLVKLGFAVPDAIVVPTDCYWAWCGEPSAFRQWVAAAVVALAAGDETRPALFSVRSGSMLSMPGALSTELNVGADTAMLKRFWQEDPTFWKQVALETARRSGFAPTDGDSALEGMLTSQFPVPSLHEQLVGAAETVFRSSRCRRAIGPTYLGLDVDLGTSCIIQAMVHGNYGADGAAGAIATCDPVTGAPRPAGAFVRSGTGQVIVSGESGNAVPIAALRKTMPARFDELCAAGAFLERSEKYPIELEFVIEKGTLWLLQARRASLSRQALAAWLARGWRASRLSRLDAARSWLPSRHLLPPGPKAGNATPSVDPVLVRGTAVSGGLGTGPLAWAECEGDAIPSGAIVALERLDPARDLELIVRAAGLITSRGGISSHAAALCRKLAIPYISNIPWATRGGSAAASDHAPFSAGEQIWINGSQGHIGRGSPPSGLSAATRAEISLDAITAAYRRRSWFRAHGESDRAVERLRSLSASRLCEAPWRTDKARVAELHELVPRERRIASVVVAARDEEGLRRVMLEGIGAGYSPGPKCSFAGAPRLGSGSWQFDLTGEAEVEAFLRDPDFAGPSRRGGYRLWASDPDLSEIIVMLDPRQKRSDVPREQRFVASMTISADKRDVVIEILPNTWRLRDFDGAQEADVIRISANLDTLTAGGRYAIATFGRAITGDTLERSSSVLLPDEGAFWLADPALDSLIPPNAAKLAEMVTQRLLGDWWNDAPGLPVLMDVFEQVAGLDSIEFQGRIGSGEEDFFLMFDLKGGEEARAAAPPKPADAG